MSDVEKVMLGWKRACHACGKLVTVYRPRANPDGLRIFRKHHKGDVAKTLCYGSYQPIEKNE